MFDLSNVKAKDFSTIPDGKYICHVSEAAMKDTKDRSGMYIAVELTIDTGEQAGRKIFTNINVENRNPKAVEIGLQTLKSLLVCSGFPTPDKLGGVEQLGGLKVGVKTKIRKSEEYGDKAEVHYFFNPGAAPDKAQEDIAF